MNAPPPTPFTPTYSYESSPIKGADLLRDPPSEGERFPEKRRFRDLPFLIFFILHLVAFFVIFVSVRDPSRFHGPHDSSSDSAPPENPMEERSTTEGSQEEGSEEDSGSGEVFPSEVKLMFACIISIIACVGFNRIWLSLLKWHAIFLIYLSIGLTVIFLWIFALALVSGGALGAGIVFIAIGVLELAFAWLFRSRIAFAGDTLSCVANVFRQFRGMNWVAWIMILPMTAWILLWFSAFRRVALIISEDGSAIAWLLAFYLIFSLYWTTQVMNNVLHVSCSGVYATWYFMAEQLPPRPTLGSVKRALTTSFGSICFGSLLVAAIKTVRAFAILRGDDGNCIACFMDCILSVIDSIFQYFNRYAYVQVAVYGKTFCQSAKATWNMFKLHGFEAVINDDFTGNVLFMGTILGAIFAGLAAGLFALLFEHASHDTIAVYMVCAFVVGLLLSSLTMQVIDSGVATIFVCFVEQPERLQALDSEFYNKFKDAYSQQSIFMNPSV